MARVFIITLQKIPYEANLYGHFQNKKYCSPSQQKMQFLLIYNDLFVAGISKSFFVELLSSIIPILKKSKSK